MNVDIPEHHTQFKEFDIKTANTFPFKLLGIFVVFFGLFYLLFSYSEAVYENLERVLGTLVSSMKSDVKHLKTAKNQTKEKVERMAESAKDDIKNTLKKDTNANLEDVKEHLKTLTNKSNNVEKKKTPVLNQSSAPLLEEKTTKDQMGYCYIGEDKGMRTCVHVDNANDCLSGNLFPNEKQCVNPHLRYDL